MTLISAGRTAPRALAALLGLAALLAAGCDSDADITETAPPTGSTPAAVSDAETAPDAESTPADTTETTETPPDADEPTPVGGDGEGGGDPVAADVEIVVADGTVTGGGRHAVAVGDEVSLTVTSDVDDHLHVHGYDLFAAVSAGSPASITFTADLPGVWEVELEDRGLLLVELEVG